jgi:hypothetical protein
MAVDVEGHLRMHGHFQESQGQKEVIVFASWRRTASRGHGAAAETPKKALTNCAREGGLHNSVDAQWRQAVRRIR